MKARALDPTTDYATQVVAGAIVASRLVRLACARHLNDIEHQADKGLIWQADSAQEAIDFFAEVLHLPEDTDVDEDVEADAAVSSESGRPFVLSPHQAFIIGSLFGWSAIHISKKTGARRVQLRFRIAFYQGGKGDGKTPLFAGCLIYMLVRHGTRGNQCFCAAVTKDQAKIAFADCVKMVEASPALQQLITHTGNNLAVKSTGSFIRPISAERRGLDGKRVQGAVVDELHEAPSNIVMVKLRAGIKGRPNALILVPTNAGFDRETVCWEYVDYSRQILEGTLTNESWFAFVAGLDACDRCHAAGKFQPSDDCPDCDDWKVEGPHWLKAVPNLGVSLPWEYLREQVREAVALPSQRNMVRRLNFCQWTDQRAVFIPAETWAACATPLSRAAFLASLEGRDCFLGIDLSDKIDLSSVVCLFPRALGLVIDPERELAEAAADEGHADVDDVAPPDDRPMLDCAVDVLPYFWMPEKTLARRAQEDKIAYPDWKQDRWVKTTPGVRIDHDAIFEFIVGVLAVKYRLRGIGIDNASASGLVSKLKRHFGEEFVEEIPQGFTRLSDPTKTLEALVVSVNLTHDGNPCMAWCLANMAIEENAWRQIRPVKMTQRKRIDGGVALIDALERLGATEAEDPPSEPYLAVA